jgi:quercetin dioxygenase-like cupin family protein
MVRQWFFVAVAVVFCGFLCGCARTQEVAMAAKPSVTRKDLLTAVMSPENVVSKIEVKEVTMGPGQKAPLHLHPCPVVGVITEGSISFQIEGQAAQHLKTGDAFYEPANVRVSHFDNDGETPAKFAAFYLLGKDEQELIRILPK